MSSQKKSVEFKAFKAQGGALLHKIFSTSETNSVTLFSQLLGFANTFHNRSVGESLSELNCHPVKKKEKCKTKHFDKSRHVPALQLQEHFPLCSV